MRNESGSIVVLLLGIAAGLIVLWVMLLDKGLFSFGHDLGKIQPCSSESKDRCFTFDFMAIRSLPPDASVGSRYSEGNHDFHVTRQVDILLAGRTFTPYRVEVFKEGKPANSYLFDKNLGVVGIGIFNFDNRNIPESLFFISGERGVFAGSGE